MLQGLIALDLRFQALANDMQVKVLAIGDPQWDKIERSRERLEHAVNQARDAIAEALRDTPQPSDSPRSDSDDAPDPNACVDPSSIVVTFDDLPGYGSLPLPQSFASAPPYLALFASHLGAALFSRESGLRILNR